MDFSLSKSQQMLKKSVTDFLKKECRELAREAEELSEGYSPQIWQKIADLGWLGIGIPEGYGGLGGDFFDHIIVLQEMGRSLFPGPFIPSAVCASRLLLEFGSESQKADLLPLMLDGKLIIIPALFQPDSFAGECHYENCQFSETGDGKYKISGNRLFVPYASTADYYLVSFDQVQNQSDGTGRQFLVDAKSPGVNRLTLQTIASDKQGEVIFDEVEISDEDVLVNHSNTETFFNRVRDIGSLAHSAYILGMLERVLEMTVEYAKNRVQFEKPIGQFQVIQHQCADMMIDLEQVRYLTYQAGWNISQGLPATKKISMAKARASDASRRVCLLGIKIQGGIGIIEEYDMQLYFRHAKAMELAFGDGDYHREIVAAELDMG